MAGTYRITTNGLFRNYRQNLGKNSVRLNSAMEHVQTERIFNTFAEDPSSASRAFRLRRTYWRTEDQIRNTNYQISRHETAYSAVRAIVDGTTENPGLDGIESALRALTDTAGTGRSSLGLNMVALSDSIVSMMNSQYGDDFLFAGTDGGNAPFKWDGDTLLYRNVDVSAADGTNEMDQLKEMANETSYVDIGLGMEEDENGEILPETAYNGAMCGIQIIGYGRDEDGDSKNLAVIMRELGNIYARTDPISGNYTQEGDGERAARLTNKLFAAIEATSKQHVQISTDTDYLTKNLDQLKESEFLLTNQINDVERDDPAKLITEMSWAQYCYSAALRIGTNILSQSLIDYMN